MEPILDIEDLIEEAQYLMSSVASFCFNAGYTDSRLALSLGRLQGAMEVVLEEIESLELMD